MNYLLDTCVISEFVKPQPSLLLLEWLREQSEESLYLSTVTIGEIQFGISRLAPSRHRQELQTWLETGLLQRFAKRIVGMDVVVGRRWGNVRASAEQAGRPLPVLDAIIATIALVYEMAVVTRNVKHLEATGATILNPWDPS